LHRTDGILVAHKGDIPGGSGERILSVAGGILAVTWWWRFMASSAEILMSTLDGGTLTVVV
jgi:hypothetical protein